MRSDLFMALVGSLAMTAVAGVAAGCRRGEERHAIALPTGAGATGADAPALVRLTWTGTQEPRSTALLPGWRLTGEPDVAFDGRRVLLTGRRPGDDRSRIFEMDAGGSVPVERHACRGDCGPAAYVSGDGIVFGDTADPAPARSLYVLDRSGHAERITFGDAVDTPLGPSPDGRVLFERTTNGGEPLVLLVNLDGTGVAPHPQGRAASRPKTGPRLLEPRQAPPAPTTLVDRKRSTGWLLCLDASRTRADPGGPPAGSGTPPARRVRLYDDQGLLGETAVETDGSFYVEVPADRLLRLETLDAAGRVLARNDTGFWVRPNEHRGCLGCHERPSVTPENRTPLAVRKPAVLVTRAASS